MQDIDSYRAFLIKIKEHKLFPYGIAAIRGVFMYVTYALMCLMTVDKFRSEFHKTVEDLAWNSQLLRILLEVILLFLMLNTVILTFSIYYKRDRLAFLAIYEQHPNQFDAKAERAKLLRSNLFYTELATLCICFLIFPMLWGYDNFVWWTKENPVFAKVISTLVFTLASFLIMLHSRIDARNMWLEMPGRLAQKNVWKSMRKKKAAKFSYPRMILRLVGYALLYSLSMKIVVFVIAMLLSIVGMVGLILMTPVLLFFVLFIVFLYYFRAIRTRVKFIRKLKKTCRENGYDLFYLKRPYRSIFRDNESYTFALTANNKTYYCRILASVKRSNKLILDEDGTCTRHMGLHIPQPQLANVRGYVQTYDRGNGDNREFMSFSSVIDYTFEADGNKILIINPVPKRVLRRFEKTTREMDNGDKIGEYTVYTGNAFLRYIIRLGELEKEGRCFHDSE